MERAGKGLELPGGVNVLETSGSLQREADSLVRTGGGVMTAPKVLVRAAEAVENLSEQSLVSVAQGKGLTVHRGVPLLSGSSMFRAGGDA